MSFWGELRRRKVVKVAIAYAIVGWILVQVAATFFPALQLPESSAPATARSWRRPMTNATLPANPRMHPMGRSCIRSILQRGNRKEQSSLQANERLAGMPTLHNQLPRRVKQAVTWRTPLPCCHSTT
jgi:hypothetical protein